MIKKKKGLTVILNILNAGIINSNVNTNKISNSTGSQVIYPSNEVKALSNVEKIMIIKRPGKSLMSDFEKNTIHFYKTFGVLSNNIKKELVIQREIKTSKALELFMRTTYKERFNYVIRSGGQFLEDSLQNSKFKSISDAFKIEQSKRNLNLKKPLVRKREIFEKPQGEIRRVLSKSEKLNNFVKKIIELLKHYIIKFFYVNPTEITKKIYKIFPKKIANVLAIIIKYIDKNLSIMSQVLLMYSILALLIFIFSFGIYKVINIYKTLKKIYCVKIKKKKKPEIDTCRNFINAMETIVKGLLVTHKDKISRLEKEFDNICAPFIKICVLIYMTYEMLVVYTVHCGISAMYSLKDFIEALLLMYYEELSYFAQHENTYTMAFINFLAKYKYSKLRTYVKHLLIFCTLVISTLIYIFFFFVMIVIAFDAFHIISWILSEIYNIIKHICSQAKSLIKAVFKETFNTFKNTLKYQKEKTINAVRKLKNKIITKKIIDHVIDSKEQNNVDFEEQNNVDFKEQNNVDFKEQNNVDFKEQNNVDFKK